MGIEIERKFLLKSDAWRGLVKGDEYKQGYLSRGECTVRVRTAAGKGFLTIKGKNTDIVRTEFEYEIPLADAEEMLKSVASGGLIEKLRYCIPYQGFIWEVDEFKGANSGLVLAEIELSSPEQSFPVPEWIGEEVTGDPRYYNSSLALNPYPFT